MNTVERIKIICKERKIAISSLEKNCGFANGYIGQLKKGTMPADRLKKVCDFLSLDIEEMLGSENYQIDNETHTWDFVIDNKDMKILVEAMSDKDNADRLIAYAKKLIELKNMEDME